MLSSLGWRAEDDMPATDPKFHRHLRNMHAIIYGVKLEDGDVVEKTDVYESTNGSWERATCPGVTLGDQGARSIWVRPMPEPEGTIKVQQR
jgi:hypothetical protein